MSKRRPHFSPDLGNASVGAEYPRPFRNLSVEQVRNEVASEIQRVEAALETANQEDTEDREWYLPSDIEMKRVVAAFAPYMEEGDAEAALYYIDRLEREIGRDGLTGAANKRAYKNRMEQMFAGVDRARFDEREPEPFTIAVLDIDNFKKFNTVGGHPAGDAVLQQLALLVQEQLRPSDGLYRYGGEEWVVVMPNTTAEQASVPIDRMMESIRNQLFQRVEGNVDLQEDGAITRLKAAGIDKVTVSVGVAEQQGDSAGDSQSLFVSADTALYAAKEGGRDMQVVATEPVEGPAPKDTDGRAAKAMRQISRPELPPERDPLEIWTAYHTESEVWHDSGLHFDAYYPVDPVEGLKYIFSRARIRSVIEEGKQEFPESGADLQSFDVEAQDMAQMARIDDLTELPNNAAYSERMEELRAESHRQGASVAMMMFDIDFFKKVNDEEGGHLVGDIALKAMGKVLKRLARKEEFVARYGGEEFVVLIPSKGELRSDDDRADFEHEVDKAAERFRSQVEAEMMKETRDLMSTFKIPSQFQRDTFTVTIGSSITHPTAYENTYGAGEHERKVNVWEVPDAKQMYTEADSAMYVGKNQGRNQHIRFNPHQMELIEK